jgi:thymidylate synthase
MESFQIQENREDTQLKPGPKESNETQKSKEEQQYLDLIKTVLEDGEFEQGRNGNTLSIFGYMMRFSLKDGALPLITTKQVAWKTCFRELMWFIQGKTDNQELQKQNVHIWDANASRQFLDSRGLEKYPEGVLGPVYGYQWRHFGAPYICGKDVPYWNKDKDKEKNKDDDKRVETPPQYAGIDQLQNIIDSLRDPVERTSRRLIMTAWNPAQINQMALPPCHILAQFRVKQGNRLSCALYQRSGDIGLGVPFNIASYSLLTHLLAKHCGLVADEFVHFLGDAHIYESHIDSLKQQIERTPLDFPRINIKTAKSKIDDYDLVDIEFVEPYLHHPKIEMQMVA